MDYIVCKSKITDVTDKGIVLAAANAFGNVDADNDISVKGSFTKTIAENLDRVKWFLNHDRTKLLGVTLSAKQTDFLEMEGQLNMEKTIGKDTFTDYKLYAEHGKTLEHSVGVDAIKRDDKDNRKVTEWKLWEWSTLTSWGANPNTALIGIKDKKDLAERIDWLEKSFKGAFSINRMKLIENQLSSLTKAFKAELLVTCASCGLTFDFNGVPLRTFEQHILDLAAMYARWLVDDIVWQEVQKLEPEIREQVVSLINLEKASNQKFTIKALTLFDSFVNCPQCGTIVTQETLVKSKPGNLTLKNGKPLDFEKMNTLLTQKNN